MRKQIVAKGLRGWKTAAPPPTLRHEERWVEGQREVRSPTWYSEKAVMFECDGWQLWLPIKALTSYESGKFSCEPWAIESAKGTKGLHTLPDTELLKMSETEITAYYASKQRERHKRYMANNPDKVEANRVRNREHMRKKREARREAKMQSIANGVDPT